MSTEDVLLRLSETLALRRNADPGDILHRPSFFAQGRIRSEKDRRGMCRTDHGGQDGKHQNIVYESADVLITSWRCWLSTASAPDLLNELQRREGTSGIAEKEIADCQVGEDHERLSTTCRIARGDIPARKVFEDDQVIAFHDINPARPMHLLVVPKHGTSSRCKP